MATHNIYFVCAYFGRIILRPYSFCRCYVSIWYSRINVHRPDVVVGAQPPRETFPRVCVYVHAYMPFDIAPLNNGSSRWRGAFPNPDPLATHGPNVYMANLCVKYMLYISICYERRTGDVSDPMFAGLTRDKVTLDYTCLACIRTTEYLACLCCPVLITLDHRDGQTSRCPQFWSPHTCSVL